MAKEEKTIDGFSVRTAKDSKLVTRSRVSKTPASRKPSSSVVKNTTVRKPSSVKSTKKSTSPKQKKPQSIRVHKVEADPLVEKRKTLEKSAPVANPVEVFTESPDLSIEDEGLEAELFGANSEAHEDFLAPVESFDFGTDESEVSEGRVEEVDNEEVLAMKKSKKELKLEAKAAEKERKALAKSAKKKKKGHKVAKIILLIFLLLLVGAGVAFYLWGDAILKKITGGEGNVWSAINAVTSETYEPLKTDANGRTNILAYGTSGYDMDGTAGDGTHDGAQLTDSIMVISLDQSTGDIAMISLPRDLKAGYTCTATGKVNEVYWCANQSGTDEAAGAAALQAKIQEILGIDTQYYVHVNWGSLVTVVDILDGVTVTLDEDIEDYYWTGAVYEKGVEYTLNGEQALGLARARHGTKSGDFTRGASQQKILIALKDKIMTKGLGLTDAISLISALGDNVRTNVNMSEIKTAAHLAEEFDLNSIRQIPLVGEGTQYMVTADIGGISYVVPSAGVNNYSAIQEYVAHMLESNPLKREDATVAVLNGSGIVGAAAKEAEKLESEGYKITKVDDAPEGEYPYTVEVEVYDASEGLKPETKKLLEDYYGVELKPESSLPNGISGYGYDFLIILGSNAEDD